MFLNSDKPRKLNDKPVKLNGRRETGWPTDFISKISTIKIPSAFRPF